MSDETNPFQSPQTTSTPSAAVGDAALPFIPPYASGNTRAVWAMFMLVTVMIGELVAISSDLAQVKLLERAMSGTAIRANEVQDNDSRQQLVSVVGLVASLGSAIAFLMWFHRVHRNLRSLRATEIKYSPAWAVGSFFVPILNLILPFLIMREVWRGSDPRTAADEAAVARYASVSVLVGSWWALWIVMTFFGQALIYLAIQPKTPASLYTLTWLKILGNGISLLGAIVTIALVGMVNKNQDVRHQSIAASETKAIVDPFAPDFSSWPKRQ